jgi:hypothetical protein
MWGENAELARAALAAFTGVHEGLVDPQRLEEFFDRDVVATPDEALKTAGLSA